MMLKKRLTVQQEWGRFSVFGSVLFAGQKSAQHKREYEKRREGPLGILCLQDIAQE